MHSTNAIIIPKSYMVHKLHDPDHIKLYIYHYETT